MKLPAATPYPGGLLEGWEFVQRDLNDGPLPFPNGCADQVRTSQVIEHVANPLHFVPEAGRVLRAGGVSVASIPGVRYVAPSREIGTQGLWFYDFRARRSSSASLAGTSW